MLSIKIVADWLHWFWGMPKLMLLRCDLQIYLLQV